MAKQKENGGKTRRHDRKGPPRKEQEAQKRMTQRNVVVKDEAKEEVKGEENGPNKGNKEAAMFENNENPDGEDSGDYDEDEDDDYDPESNKNPVSEPESESESDKDAAPDYSAVTAAVSSVRTRSQRERELPSKQPTTLVVEDSKLDISSIFQELKQRSKNPHLYREEEKGDEKPEEKPAEDVLGPEKIRIETSYAFAGKVITELKLVDSDSAEAKAYLSSTSALSLKPEEERKNRSSIPVIRKLPNSEETVELRIKLKRPSLIDKFLGSVNNKRLKLSTLEKSRLDWASFVDKRKIKDELSIHNKGGYLDRQDFLGRVDAKRGENFAKAREENRQRSEAKLG